MFDKMNSQLEASLKPVNELAALNMATIQDLASKQTALFQTLMNSSTSFAQTATQHKDVASLGEAQKAYFEALQATFTNSAKDVYDVVTGAQEKATAVIKTVSEESAAKFKFAG